MHDQLKSRRGVTLLELLIAGLVGAVTTLLVGSLLKHFSKSGNVIEERLRATGEDIVGNQAIWHDVRRSGVSFNFLNGQLDDNGRPFYDFLPDFACSVNCARQITIRPGTGFIMALTAGGMAPPTPITPTTFFDMPDAPDLMTHGTVTFNSARFQQALDAIDPITDPTLRMRTEGKVLRFYAPFYQRRHNFSGAVDLSVPPRMLSFVGIVRSGNVEPVGGNPSTVGTVAWAIGPQLRPDLGLPVDNVEMFFRFLPPAAGTGAFGLVVPIELVKYWIEPVTMADGKQTGELRRYTFDGADFVNYRVLASTVSSLIFQRKDISVPSIQPTLQVDRKDYRKLMNIKDGDS